MVTISSLWESRKKAQGRQANFFKASDMKVAYFSSTHPLLRELGHMAILSCKGSWEILPLAELPLCALLKFDVVKWGLYNCEQWEAGSCLFHRLKT